MLQILAILGTIETLKLGMNSLLDEFDVIECFEQQGRELRWGEMTKMQIEIYHTMCVNPPSLE
jgi:ABC-type lipopolysaccharide export system ATPase subunit